MQILNFARSTNFKRLKFDELADAANNGDGIAAYMCVYLADNGMGVIPVDEVLAVDWALQGMELKGDGGILCQAWLGMKLSGISLSTNPDAAILLEPTFLPLQKMAEKGNLHAMTMLGVIARYGHGGTEFDLDTAKKYLGPAVRSGHPDALLHMGVFYSGKDLPQNIIAQQHTYLRRSAELDHASAQFHLAMFHKSHQPNRKLEKNWLDAAATQELPLAMEYLGEWHYSNKTIRGAPNPNLPEAFRLWRKAAEQGSLIGSIRVAECYATQKYFYLKANEDGGVVDGSMARAYATYCGLLNNNGLHVRHKKLPDDYRRQVLSLRQRLEQRAERIMVGDQEHLSWAGQGVTAPRHQLG